jgi:hypothetical protein
MCVTAAGYLIPSLVGGLWILINTLTGAFLGAHLAYRLAQHTQDRADRRKVYDRVSQIFSRYSGLLVNHKKPTDAFLASITELDLQVADRFTAAAYETWRKAHEFFTADGSLPGNKTEYDFQMAAAEALKAIRKEL